MNNAFQKISAFAVLMILLSGCGQRESSVVIALAPDKDPDAMQEEKEALNQFLADQLSLPVEVIVPLSGAVITEGLRNGTVDVAHISSTQAARLEREGIIDVLLAGEIDGLAYYQSYWVGLRGTPYQSIEDLRDKPVAFASPTSTSGYIIPVWDMHKRGLFDPAKGLESFFGQHQVLFGTGYVSAIERVLNGQAEAAAVSDYVIKGDKHLSAEQKSRLRVIQQQGPVPTHVLVVRRALSTTEKDSLKTALLALNTSGTELRDRIFSANLIPADSQHLHSIREALTLVESIR